MDPCLPQAFESERPGSMPSIGIWQRKIWIHAFHRIWKRKTWIHAFHAHLMENDFDSCIPWAFEREKPGSMTSIGIWKRKTWIRNFMPSMAFETEKSGSMPSMGIWNSKTWIHGFHVHLKQKDLNPPFHVHLKKKDLDPCHPWAFEIEIPGLCLSMGIWKKRPMPSMGIWKKDLNPCPPCAFGKERPGSMPSMGIWKRKT